MNVNYELEIVYTVYDGENRVSKLIDDGDYSIERIRELFEMMKWDICKNEVRPLGTCPPTVIMNGKLYDFDRIEYWLEMNKETYVGKGQWQKNELPTDIIGAVEEYKNGRILLWEKDWK